ncbi:MAG: S8 family serine peptidase [Firmicutes bacterium]|nr:S8 family serine peptidase [Bacillota bacterium]
MLRKNLPHIILPDPPEKYKYINPIKSPNDGQQTPQRDRKTHAEHLIQSFDKAWQIARDDQVVYHTTRNGVYLEFRSSPGYELITKSLEDLRTKKVRLCNVRKRNLPKEVDKETKPVIYATVYISNDSREFFLKKLNDYAEKDHSTGTPKNLKVVNSISDILNASLIKSFWVSEEHLIPDESPQWCEVWLRVDSDTKEEIENVINIFDDLLAVQDVTSKPGYLLFPERVVKLVHVNGKQLETLTRYCDYIAEYRIAKDTTSFWVGMQTREQTEWVENLTERLQINKESLVSICLLDTGVNYGHPLLAPVFDQSDCHSCNVLWGVYDHDKHGTLMAGILVYGNLDEQLSSSGRVFINHKIESVKILPPKGENSIELWGLITSQGVSLPIIKAPERMRIYCMVTIHPPKKI